MTEKGGLKNYIRQLEERLLTPEVRSSKAELKKLLADDFWEIGSSGNILYKNEEIADDGIGIVQIVISDFELQILSETVVLATYKIFNQLSNQHSLRSSIWKLNNQQWQMVFHQGTRTNVSI